ncbi:hypothetical protein [Candidatus Chromulinivorax destructor]|uniref:Uncharacterized protein n=1 Tax=Candidatus Chromulinivorax destructor TaxID=2066483 RepID=A0A345ZCH5_9BACT|nr:hypothetical protein [Candidatus Chromulinivorax destructor]AXK60992.1 hypothetical protein C0J27_04640 [Candidatus Chromulinivorax destructor]
MVKNVYKYMIFSMVAVCCFDAQASQADKDFVNRSMDKNDFAMKEFEKLLDKQKLSLFEEKCLIDAYIAKYGLELSFGLKWIAVYDAYHQINERNSIPWEKSYRNNLHRELSKSAAIQNLAALQAIQDKACQYRIEPVNDMLSRWNPSFKNIYFDEETFEGDGFDRGYIYSSNHDVDISMSEIHHKYGSTASRHVSLEFKERHDALQQHVKTPCHQVSIDSNGLFDIQDDNQTMISEFEYVEKLRSENPIDNNPETNKFIKCFDQIA